MSKHILVTGGAGFIGFHLCRRLLEDGFRITAVDVINDYYDVKLKNDRLAILHGWSDFTFCKLDLADNEGLQSLFREENIDSASPIIHLAAQAGVRYALENPRLYISSNIVAFHNLLEMARQTGCGHFLYASSSSVYGGNVRLPFSVHDNVDHPVSLYGATKKSNELLAHVYSHTYGLPTTGLRFFTVYGPWGRPDMAYFNFTKSILAGEPLAVFNHGDMSRDFTYIDDIIEGIVRLINHVPAPDPGWDRKNPDPGTSWAPFRIYNIGNHKPVELLEFIGIIEKSLGKKATLDFQPMQICDVKATYAEIEDLTAAVGFYPETPLSEGIPRFIEWYKDYYGVTA